MKVEIRAEGVNDEAIKILLKAIRKLYSPYEEHYYGLENFNVKIGKNEI